MRNLALIAIAIALAGFIYHWQKTQTEQMRIANDEKRNPEIINNPVYAEIHMDMNVKDRSIEQVLLIKAVDEEDCQNFSKNLSQKIIDHQGPGMKWKVERSDCSPSLIPRYANLFDNKPTDVTYLSVARGDRREREMRLIYWGVSTEESNRVCGEVSKFQRLWKGQVTCIRAATT